MSGLTHLAHQPRQLIDIVVRKYDTPGRREPRAVNQARVVAIIREDDVTWFGERRQHGGIGAVAARKIERGFRSLEPRDAFLDRRKRLTLASQQTRSGAATSLESGGLDQPPDDRWMRGEVEVVVGGEVDARRRSKGAQQAGRFPVGQPFADSRF